MAREVTMGVKEVLQSIPLIAVGVLLMIAIGWIRDLRRRAKGVSERMSDDAITQRTLPTPATQFSLGRQPHSDKLPRRSPSPAKIFFAAVMIAVLAVAVFVGYLMNRPQAKPVAANPCAACKVERIPNSQLTQEQLPDGRWKHIGHKCVGATKCASSCQVDNCFSESDDIEPTGCDHCSATGK